MNKKGLKFFRVLFATMLILTTAPLSIVSEVLAEPIQNRQYDRQVVAQLTGQELVDYFDALSLVEQAEFLKLESVEQKLSVEKLGINLEKRLEENQVIHGQESISSETTTSEVSASEESESIESTSNIQSENSETSESQSVSEKTVETESTEEVVEQPAVNFLRAGALLGSEVPNSAENLVLDKTATYNPATNQVDFQLEAYAKGSRITSSTATDIILMLDVSGSMKDDFSSGGGTKLNALQTAVNNFATSLFNAQAGSSGTNYQSIQLITFSSAAQTVGRKYQTNVPGDLNVLNTTVNDLAAGGGTEPDKALTLADTLMATNQKDVTRGAKQVAVMFTDGEPDGDLSKWTIASRAVNIARSLKNTRNATVYTVGIQKGANPSVIDSTDIANSMLNAISSNYKNASAEVISHWLWGITGYKLTLGAKDSTGSYYLTTNNAGGLNSIFQAIVTEIGKINQLGIKDVLAQEFYLPTTDQIGAPDIVKVYRAWTYNPSLRADDSIKATYQQTSRSIDFANLTLEPVIFDSAGQPTEATKNNKLIFRFSAKINEQFMGGNQVVTNGETSGAYMTDSSGKPVLVEAFKQPVVNIPLKDLGLTGNNQKIYLGNSAEVKSFMKNWTVLNGVNNRYVNVTYKLLKDSVEVDRNAVQAGKVFTAVASSIKVKPAEDTTYTLSYSINPSLAPAAGSQGVASMDKEVSTKLFVFKPEITSTNVTITLGQSTSLNERKGSLEWKHRTENNEGLEGVAPDLTLIPYKSLQTQASPNVVSPEVDTNYTWKVMYNEQDLTGNTTFTNRDYVGNTQPGNTHFTVYVKAAKLTINKQIKADKARDFGQETFVFEITRRQGDQQEVYYDTITLNASQTQGSVVLSGLKTGEYTIKEITPWSSRYKPDTLEKKVSITNLDVKAVTFINTLLTSKWLSQETTVHNQFGKAE